MTPREATEAEKKARERLRILGACLRDAAKDHAKAEAIHDLRVAIRRFTQMLRVFDGLFSHSRKMRRRLRGLMDLCGEARNCDIALGVLDAAGVPADHALEKRLMRRRARAARELAGRIEDWDLRSHVRRWRHWMAPKAEHPRPAPLVPQLAREFRRSGSAAAKAGAAYGQMHKFRLLVKRYRYTLEILEEEGPGSPQLNALRTLQEHLGTINDCVATSELIDDIGLSTAGKRRIKTAVNRLLARRAADFRVYWRFHFKRRIK